MKILFLIAISPATLISAQDAPAVLPECSALGSCVDCLNQEGCGHWSTGECMSDCLVMDVACYSKEYSFANNTTEEICTQADNDQADDLLCSGMSDCTSCVEAIKGDSASTCMWFADGGFCSTGCGMMGCGETSCPTNLPETSDSDISTLADESPEDSTTEKDTTSGSSALRFSTGIHSLYVFAIFYMITMW